MRLEEGQLVIILSPYADVDIYGNISFISEDSIKLKIKQNWLLKEGWEIICLVVDGNEMFEFYSMVKYIEGKDAMIATPDRSGLTNIEKRRFNRVDCEIGFIGKPYAINSIPISKLYSMNDRALQSIPNKVFSGTVKNIGANGILAETSLSLPLNMMFSLKLKIDYFIDCNAVIKWVDKAQNGNGYQIGCQFMNMELEYVKAISMYAFKEQLKNKRKELYNGLYKNIKQG